MTVFIVERGCIDPYFEPHLVAIFATEELAQEFVNNQSDSDNLEISEYEVLTEQPKE